MNPIFSKLYTALENRFGERNIQTSTKREILKKPPLMVMLNKNHHMIAYGVISWHHRKESPFEELKMPAITKVFIKQGYVGRKEFEALIRKIELTLILKGHFKFGLEIANDHFLDDKSISYLKELGYEKEIYSSEYSSIFLEKKIELLE